MLKLPEVLGVSEARNEMAHVLEEVERGRTFIIKGTKGREALMLNADVFRRFQDTYLELVGELETMRILQDEKAIEAIGESSGAGGRGQLYTLSEVESMIKESGNDGEEEPKSKLLFSRVGVETLLELPKNVQKQALRKMEMIEASPTGAGYPLHKPLQGYRGIHSNRYRIIWNLLTLGDEEQVAQVVFVGIRAEGDDRDAYAEFSKLFGLPGF